MRDKKKTKNIKVRDLKPKKDAKGGVVANVNTGKFSPLARVTAKDKVKDQRAAPWFDPSVQFLFIFFATLNEGESHKTEGRRFSPFFAGSGG